MKPWTTILAPVTMQRTVGSAIQYPIEVANALSARLVLLHVIPPAASPRDSETTLTWSRSTLAEDAADFGLEKVVLCGDTVPTIDEYAQQIDADLILMPTTRSVWSPVRRSVTSRLLSSTPRPVHHWTPANDAAPFRCRQLLCVLELDGGDGPLISVANEVAARTGANVEALHIIPNATESRLFYSVDVPRRPRSTSAATTRLGELHGQFASPHTTSIVIGERQRWIALTARRKPADLILVRRKIASAWPIVGFEPAAISKQAGCPVISVPPCEVQPETARRRLWRSERESVVCDV
jgi:nucleotide-binding universal stress UspA family protein